METAHLQLELDPAGFVGCLVEKRRVIKQLTAHTACHSEDPHYLCVNLVVWI